MIKIFKKINLIIMFVVLLVPLSAIEFQGIIFSDYYGQIEPSSNYENLRGRIYFEPTLSGSLFNYAMDYKISAKMFYDHPGDPKLIKPENIIKEAYLFIPFDNFDISLGQKLVSPGMADVFSPLNIVNGDYAYKLSLDDPYDSKRADIMVQIQYYPNFDDSVQFVYVPFPRPDYEPRGLLNLVIDTDTAADTNVDMDVIIDANPYLLNNAHSFFLSYNHMSSGFDLQLDYAYYTDQTSNFDISELNPGVSMDGKAAAFYTRYHTFGGAYSTSFNGIALVEELAVNITEDFEGTEIGIKNSDITFNSQITKTLSGGIFAQLNIVYQYVINFNKSSLNYPMLVEEFNSYFNQPVKHIAFAIAHLHKSFLREKLYFAVNIAYLHPEFYIAPRISYTLSDEIKIEVGADIKTGEPSDYTLARGNLSDNYYLRLKYEF
jgi:hypothetical protein